MARDSVGESAKIWKVSLRVSSIFPGMPMTSEKFPGQSGEVNPKPELMTIVIGSPARTSFANVIVIVFDSVSKAGGLLPQTKTSCGSISSGKTNSEGNVTFIGSSLATSKP